MPIIATFLQANNYHLSITIGGPVGARFEPERDRSSLRVNLDSAPWAVPWTAELVEHPGWGRCLSYEILSMPWQDDWDGKHQEGRRTRGSDTVIGDFLALFGGRGAPRNVEEFVEKRGDRVLGFTRRYGVLGFCRHGFPTTHQDPYAPLGMTCVILEKAEVPAPKRPKPRCHPLNPEPLSTWWKFGRHVRGTWRVGIQLKRGNKPSAETWADFRVCSEKKAKKDFDACENPRRKVEEAIRFGLIQAASHPEFSWSAGEQHPKLVPIAARSGLYGEIWKRLAFKLCSSEGYTICDGCQEPYVRRNRVAKRGQHNYCPACRKFGIPQRDAMRRYRERKRRA